VRGVHVLTVLHTGETLGPERNDFETKLAVDKFKKIQVSQQERKI
jgi:hypothetical protein